MSTASVLRASRVLRRAQRRHDLRHPTYYLLTAVLVAVGVAVLHVVGLGAIVAADRPSGGHSADGLVVAIVLTIGLAGLPDPVVRITPVEAQWFVTTPGGAAAVVASRARGVVVWGLEVTALTVVTQVLAAGSVHLASAVVLGLWAGGYSLTMLAVRFAFAAYLEPRPQPYLRRLAAMAVIGVVGFLLTRVEAIAAFLGAPGAGTGGALLSALAWCAVGVLVALVAMRQAEALVVRAILSGRPESRAVRGASRTAGRRAVEPEGFRLRGPGALTWLWLVGRRRRLRAVLVVDAMLLALSAVLAVTAPRYLLALAGLIVAAFVLVQTAERPPGPAGTSGLLLPFSYGSLVARGIPRQLLAPLELLMWPVGAWLLTGQYGELLPAVLIDLLPLLSFSAALGVGVRDTSKDTWREWGRGQRLLAALVLGTAAGSYLLARGMAGAVLAALVLCGAASAMAVHEVRAAERVGGAAPRASAESG